MCTPPSHAPFVETAQHQEQPKASTSRIPPVFSSFPEIQPSRKPSRSPTRHRAHASEKDLHRDARHLQRSSDVEHKSVRRDDGRRLSHDRLHRSEKHSENDKVRKEERRRRERSKADALARGSLEPDAKPHRRTRKDEVLREEEDGVPWYEGSSRKHIRYSNTEPHSTVRTKCSG
jgi:hypothetical protein